MIARAKLIAMLEAAKEGDRSLDWEIHCRNGLDGVGMFGNHPPYTTSFDAAMSLVPDGWAVSIHKSPPDHNCSQSAALCKGDPPFFDNIEIDQIAETAVLALCIAALKAPA